MPNTFHDRVVLLTGAAGGLGRELARLFAAEGARLLVTGRFADRLEGMVGSLPSEQRPRVTMLEARLAEPGEAHRLAQAALAVHGRVDCLVNNAGMGYFALLEEAQDERVRELFQLNTFTPISLARELLPGMRARGEGRIVNIVSCAGRIPIPSVGVYGASKSALAILANTMRFELKGSGIVVINVYPGTINTAFEINALSEHDRAGIDTSGQRGRPPAEVAAEVFEVAHGASGEYWLSPLGKKMAVDAIEHPDRIDAMLEPLRARVVSYDSQKPLPPEERRWRLWQLETSMRCGLDCVMCPWAELRGQLKIGEGLMSDAIWERIRPHLPQIAAVDFTGGGEPLTHPALPARLREAKAAGCNAGLLTNGTMLTPALAAELVESGMDWLAMSIDGATAESYERIRRGASFAVVTSNLRALAKLKQDGRPRLAINFVVMRGNAHELEAIVDLAHDLGVDQVNFKQCDVIRGENGRDLGLFRAEGDRETRALERALSRARRRARKLGVETTAFAFTPEEQPVCEQDPRNSIFIRHDGRIAPCIGQAYGGPTCFFGKNVVMPETHYGSILETDALDLWESPPCRVFRDGFEDRVRTYDKELEDRLFGMALGGFSRAKADARREMRPPPKGCESCHYLFGV